MKIRKGCGCISAIIGFLMMVSAIIFAVACYFADEQAGDENAAQWKKYNSHQAEIDSLENAGVADSIIYERYPQPLIRQGGFATMFGGLIGFVVFGVGAVPFAVGLLLYYKK